MTVVCTGVRETSAALNPSASAFTNTECFGPRPHPLGPRSHPLGPRPPQQRPHCSHGAPWLWLCSATCWCCVPMCCPLSSCSSFADKRAQKRPLPLWRGTTTSQRSPPSTTSDPNSRAI